MAKTIMKLLKERGLEDVLVIAGKIIPNITAKHWRVSG
jgi:methylmalonyl-CoA mutase cobalamin-binding subunit